MPPSTSRCLACNAPFQGNYQLASVPDAARVAFDPAHNRVWRICTKCDTWNLLGTEASLAAMPELVARMAVQPTAGTVSLHRVDKRLDLIRVSEDDSNGASGQEMLALRVLVDRYTLRRRVTLTVAALLVVGMMGLVQIGAKVNSAVPLLVFFDASSLLLAVQLFVWISGRKRSMPGLLVNAALVAAAAWALYRAPNRFMEAHFAMPIIQFVWLMGAAFVIRYLPVLRAGVGRQRIRISYRQLQAIAISWHDDSDAIAFHDLPDSLRREGVDAQTLGQTIFALAAQHGPSRPVFVKSARAAEAGYQLLNGLGGIRGVLKSLDGFRRDSDGRVLLADIPTIYLHALDLAFAEATGNGEELGIGGLADAQETAALAEGLDREHSE